MGEGDEPTWIRDPKNLFAQRSRCIVPTSCSASCLQCVYVCRNVATWDQFTSLLGSLPAVTLDEFPSLTLHCFTMKRERQYLGTAKGFGEENAQCLARSGPSAFVSFSLPSWCVKYRNDGHPQPPKLLWHLLPLSFVPTLSGLTSPQKLHSLH